MGEIRNYDLSVDTNFDDTTVNQTVLEGFSHEEFFGNATASTGEKTSMWAITRTNEIGKINHSMDIDLDDTIDNTSVNQTVLEGFLHEDIPRNTATPSTSALFSLEPCR